MSSWELARKLFWLPFDIMTRVSRQFLLLGRNVYGSLFGRTKPAIKPPPPSSSSSSSHPAQPTSSSSPSPAFPLQSDFILPEAAVNICTSSSTTTSTAVPSCVIDMSGTTSSSLEAYSSSPHLSISNLESLSEKNVLPTSSSSSAQQQQQQPRNDIESVGKSVPHAKEEVSTTHHSEADMPMSTIESKKRLREGEKRTESFTANQKKTKIVSNKNDNDDGEQFVVAAEKEGECSCVSVISPQSTKKAKLSEDVPPSSSSSVTAAAVATTNSDNNTSKNKKKRAKKKTTQGEQSGEPLPQEGDKMGRPPPPNYFIAVQITNKDIISKVADLQKSLSDKPLAPSWHGMTTTSVFKDAMVPVTKLHFTLHVMHLRGPQEIERAERAFMECCKEISHEFEDKPLDLTIEGLGHFKNSVLFAQIKNEAQIARLTELANQFRKRFDDINVSGDSRAFKPHLTIAKTSRSNKLYKMRIRAFPPDIWTGMEETHFGTQRVSGVQLLRMAGEDKVTGYYIREAQHDFQDNLLTKSTSVPLPLLHTSQQSNDKKE